MGETLRLQNYARRHLQVIRKPDQLEPEEGAILDNLQPTLKASPFSPAYDTIERAHRRFQVKERGGTWAAPYIDAELSSDEISLGSELALESGRGYLWRCMDVSTEGDESPWSDPVEINTGGTYVIKPEGVKPADGEEEVGEDVLLEANDFDTVGEEDTHVASQWRIIDDAESIVVFDTNQTEEYLTSIPVGSEMRVPETAEFWDSAHGSDYKGLQYGNKKYRYQVRYKGEILGWSEWSDSKEFTTKEKFTDEIETPTGESLDGAVNVSNTPTLESSSFVAKYYDNEEHKASQWRVIDEVGGSTVYDSGETEEDLTSHTLPEGYIDSGFTTHSYQVRHKGSYSGWSEWSDKVTFETAGVEKPSTISPADGESGFEEEDITLESSAFSVSDGSDELDVKEFEVAKEGEDAFWTDTTSSTTTTLPADELSENTSYQWRVRHRGQTWGWSDWSEWASFSTGDFRENIGIGQDVVTTSVSTSTPSGYARGDEAYGGIVIGQLNDGDYLLICAKYDEGDSNNVGGGNMTGHFNWDDNESGDGSTADSDTDGAYNTYQMIELGNYSTSESIFEWLQAYAQGLNGYEDWYIPSKDELDVVYQAYDDNIIDATSGNYWSSTESSSSSAWYQNLGNGSTYTGSKSGYDRRGRVVRRQPL